VVVQVLHRTQQLVEHIDLQQVTQQRGSVAGELSTVTPRRHYVLL
jgi:hypothetical protein